MGQHHLKSRSETNTILLPSVWAHIIVVEFQETWFLEDLKKKLNFPEDFVALNSEGFRCSFSVVTATLYRRQIANYKKGLPSSPRGN